MVVHRLAVGGVDTFEVDTFRRPWVMKPFAVKGLGEA